MTVEHETASVLTSWGAITLAYDVTGVIQCSLPRLESIPVEPFNVLEAGHDPYSTYIHELLGGKRPRPPAIGKLDGTVFQHEVWSGLSEIPVGKTRSYRGLAENIGRERAVRAVANACGRNPVPLFIPCHRVIASNGSVGGFSSGTAWKRLLLGVEQL